MLAWIGHCVYSTKFTRFLWQASEDLQEIKRNASRRTSSLHVPFLLSESCSLVFRKLVLVVRFFVSQ